MVSFGPFAFAWSERDGAGVWRQRYGIWHESRGDAGFCLAVWV